MSPVRVLLPLSCVILTSACQQDFDTQYAATERKVKAAEAKIDADMAKEARREPSENVKSD